MQTFAREKTAPKQPITYGLDPYVIELVRQVAERDGVPRSHVVNTVLKQALAV